jgi:hypothetical protein
MSSFLTTTLSAQALAGAAGLVVAVTLLALLLAFSVYAGLYYTIPKMVLKWLSRRALPAV